MLAYIYNSLTITNSAFTENMIGCNGGGLVIKSSIDGSNNITVANSTFTQSVVNCDGGGLIIESGIDIHNNIIITNSIITSTIVGCRGGGLIIESDNDTVNNAIITDSIFASNTVNGNGGGVLILSISSKHHNTNRNSTGVSNNITIANSILTNNVVDGVGGGLYTFSDINVNNNIFITNGTITNNSVQLSGGGLYIHSIRGVHNDISVINTIITSNSAAKLNAGGLLIYSVTNSQNSITINNSVFINNKVDTIFGGGLYIVSEKATYNIITITYSKFTGNTVDYGAGMFIRSITNIHNSLTIANTIFYNNTVNTSGAGLYIHSETGTYNNITITSSIFSNNTSMYMSSGGGLLIWSTGVTYNDIFITDSAFMGNTVYSTGSVPITAYILAGYDKGCLDGTHVHGMFTSNTVGPGVGGGLIAHSGTNTHVHIIIANSIFANNTVDDIGGGLVLISGTNYITLTNNTFMDNYVGYGGGLVMEFGTDTHNNMTINITNNIFTNNIVRDIGGGLLINCATDSHNIVTIITSVFTNNIGGSDSTSTCGLIINFITYKYSNVLIINSTFTNNDGRGLQLIYIPSMNSQFVSDMQNNITIVNSTFAYNKNNGLMLYFDRQIIKLSQVTISNNNGSGLLAIHHCTIVFIEGTSIIANNSSPDDGGGIYLDKDSYLTTSNGGHVSFINNTAHRYGGAIYCLDNDYRLFNLDINMYHATGDTCSVYSLSATFINNSAIRAGDNLYGGVFIFCQDFIKYIQDKHVFQCINVPDDIKNFTSETHPLSPISSDPLVVCPCVNSTIDCNTTSLDRAVYPGQMFSLSLATVGLCQGVSPGNIVVKHGKNITLISSTTTDYTSTSCTALNYTVKLAIYISSATLELNIVDGDLYRINPIDVHLTILPCPLGLELDPTSGDCICKNDITQILGTSCNISWMPHPI